MRTLGTRAARAVFPIAVLVIAACGSSASSSTGDAIAAIDLATPPADAIADATVPSDAGAVVGATDAPVPGGIASDATATVPSCPLAGFAPCGGELLGVWSFVKLCPEDPAAAAALCEHPYDNLSACKKPGGTVACESITTGTMTFDDAGMVTIARDYAIAATWGFSDACLAAAKPGLQGEAACKALVKPGKLACVYTPGQCTCSATVSEGPTTDSAAYTVQGNTVFLGTEVNANFCITGDRLVLDMIPHIISWRWWILDRAKR